MKWKLALAAVVMIAVGVVAWFLLAPKPATPPVPEKPPVVKPPMLRAPPREAFSAPPAPVAPPAVAAAPDASAEAPAPPPSPVADPNAVARPIPGPINHHPPPPRSAGARFLAVERRYERAQQAWTQLRSHKSPADQQKYDALLQQAGNELSSGSRQAGAQHLQDFVAGALDGVEP